MRVLVTGVTGYIGSHTAVELLNNNIELVGLDNFSNSDKTVLSSIESITNKKIKFYEGNMLDEELLDNIFSENIIDCVIDFAAFKSVGDSVSNPISYYKNNVSSVITLIEVMKKYNCFSLVFSSSATVYGNDNVMPLIEESNCGNTTNPYGTSKFFVEKILNDLYKSEPNFNICVLRYFNPVGAHESGLIGENPLGIPANLMPYITNVAIGKLECLNIFGNDYDTKDGTGVRDYIHIIDLAKAHVLSVNKLLEENGYFVYNLGTGNGYSVLDIVNTYQRVNNVKVNYKISSRRSGDVASCYSSCDKAYKELGFKATKTLEDMCRDAHNYMIKNK